MKNSANKLYNGCLQFYTLQLNNEESILLRFIFE